MNLSINFAILTLSFLSNFLKHFSVSKYENLLIFFWKAIQIAGSAQKKSVGLAETQGIFRFVFFRPKIQISLLSYRDQVR